MNKILKNISLSEIIPYEKNNKKHGKNVDEIIKSIQANTYITPIIIDENNIILAGHGRKLALDKLQVKETEVLQVTGLSEEQKRDFRIRDNKLTELSEWDRDNLKFELDDLNIPDLTNLFKDEEEMEEETPEAKEDDFEVDDKIKTDIVLGDLFEIGEHRLLCGDSTNIDDVNKLMNGEKAELLLTDPPYGINYGKQLIKGDEFKEKTNKHGWRNFGNPNWDLEIPKDAFPFFHIYSNNQIVWGGNYFTDLLYPSQGWLLWDKGQRDFSLADGEMAWTSFDNALRIKTYARAKANQEEKVHPTQKPIEIISWCIEYADRHGGAKTILDLFGGSGSTMVACHQLNRKCYMSELDPKYVQTIVNRMHKLDPSLTFKKNGQPYNPETNDYLLDK